MSPLVLVSEFITVDHGKYIVKVSALSNQKILGTGLAGAETVEKAEDEARQRAIAVIDWTSKMTPPTTPPITHQNISSSSPAPTHNYQVKPPLPSQSITGKKQKAVTVSSIEPPEQPSAINPPITPKNDQPKTTELSVSPQPEAIDYQPEKTKISPIPQGEAPSSTNTSPNPTATEAQEKNLPRETEIESRESPEIQPELDFPLPLEPVNSADNSTNSLDNHTSPTASTNEMTGTMDFSQIINQTTIEIKRLGWTQEDGKKYLLATYGKKSRHLLSDAELIEFLHYLQQQP